MKSDANCEIIELDDGCYQVSIFMGRFYTYESKDLNETIIKKWLENLYCIKEATEKSRRGFVKSLYFSNIKAAKNCEKDINNAQATFSYTKCHGRYFKSLRIPKEELYILEIDYKEMEINLAKSFNDTLSYWNDNNRTCQSKLTECELGYITKIAFDEERALDTLMDQLYAIQLHYQELKKQEENTDVLHGVKQKIHVGDVMVQGGQYFDFTKKEEEETPLVDHPSKEKIKKLKKKLKKEKKRNKKLSKKKQQQPPILLTNDLLKQINPNLNNFDFGGGIIVKDRIKFGDTTTVYKMPEHIIKMHEEIAREKKEKEKPTGDDDDDEEDVTLCKICYDKKKNTAFNPCGHYSSCRECAEEIQIKTNECPICRKTIISLSHIFES